MNASVSPSHLRRVLKLRDLILYGIVIITPIAPVPIYGVAQTLSRGHVILTLAIAGVAMMLTAWSYGRMSHLYPSAGSAYVYVGRGLNTHLGFFAGWTMALDYVVLPIVAIVQASLAISRLLPSVPYAAWVTGFTVLVTVLNLRGIRTTARTNMALLTVMTFVIAAFFILAIKYVSDMHGPAGLLSIRPIYDPETFDIRAIAIATSFAALTYIGFDGVTTLAEDVQNPQRNVPLATVSVCMFTTLFSCLLVYVAQLVIPDYRSLDNVETAFLDVTQHVGGLPLFHGMGIVVILSSLGAALAGIVAAARVLLAMGRDNVLPQRFFGRVDSRSDNPIINILFVAVITWAGSLLLNLERAGELLNFGALLGFMGVNLAAFRQNYLLSDGKRGHFLTDAVAPLLGFLFCLAIWLTLPRPAKLVGGIWLLIGVVYYIANGRGARRKVQAISTSTTTQSG
jgi:amino acid transporter